MRVLSSAAALLVLGLLFPTASEAAWEPPGGVVFNNPAGTRDEQWRILDSVDRAIQNAVPGSKILMSTFLMDNPSTIDALLAAYYRGVEVQLVLDGANADNDATRRVAAVVNADNIDPATGRPPLDVDGSPMRWGVDDSFVVYCKESCRGQRGGINHAKFYVFSQTGTARNVVMISSSNLNMLAPTRGWNDLYTLKEKPRMVTEFGRLILTMAEDEAPADEPYAAFTYGRYTHRFYPTFGGIDPVLEDLAKVRCRGADGGAGLNGRTAINIAMFLWTGNRGAVIAQRLLELARQGCEVKVIYAVADTTVTSILEGAARDRVIRLWRTRLDVNGDGVEDFRTHEKYMLISGVFDGDASSWRVFTGTQNWSGATIFNSDDNSLVVDSRRAYNSYLHNWDYIRAGWARRVR